MNTLFIRADATSQIGSGHVMRCIALAQAWQDQGGRVTFISHCDSDTLRIRIIGEGFNLVSIEKPHPHPSDLTLTLSCINPETTGPNTGAWLVLDGYHFTPDYQKAIKDAGIRLLIIDDMNHLPYYHADIILNQNIHATDLKYNCDPNTKLLLGPKYVLLRREFLKYRDFKREIPDKARKILVTMGGADPDNVTLKVIQALNLLNDSELEVKVVIGPSNPHMESIKKELSLSPFSFQLLPSVDNMADLMAWADLAITAGGSTCWELAYMGVPSILIVLAKNQVPLAEKLSNHRRVLNLGWHVNVTPFEIVAAVTEVIGRKEICAEKVENALKMVDGKGTKRILSCLEEKIMLRPVQKEDCELIWMWSNDEGTRKASFFEVFIPWEEHVEWFNSRIADQNHYFYIITDSQEKPIGQIRFSVKSDNAVVSFSIAPEFRGFGIGTKALKLGTQKLFQESNVNAIIAFVRVDNQVSLKVFQKAGFVVEEELYLHDKKSYKLSLYRGNEYGTNKDRQ